MTVALAVSRVALGMAMTALFLSLAASRARRGPNPGRRRTVMAVATLALGMALLAFFFGLVSGCDRP